MHHCLLSNLHTPLFAILPTLKRFNFKPGTKDTSFNVTLTFSTTHIVHRCLERSDFCCLHNFSTTNLDITINSTQAKSSTLIVVKAISADSALFVFLSSLFLVHHCFMVCPFLYQCIHSTLLLPPPPLPEAPLVHFVSLFERPSLNLCPPFPHEQHKPLKALNTILSPFSVVPPAPTCANLRQ
jgi:hypothetical protein